MSTHLGRILEATRGRLQEQMRRRTWNDLEREAVSAPPPRDFRAALSEAGMALIAEIKRSSPSAGDISREADPAVLASAYERGGARAVSVLTEPQFFKGSLEDLQKARAETSLPVLRKDFLIDPYQIVEARAAEADAVLLIVSALDDRGLLRDMAAAAREFGLSALVEIHDEHELERAFEVEPAIVGVNQRNLRTFEVDAGLAVRLRKEVPKDVVMVAESGVKSRSDVEKLEAAEVDAVLVGETLMRSGDPAGAVRQLLGREDDERD